MRALLSIICVLLVAVPVVAQEAKNPDTGGYRFAVEPVLGFSMRGTMVAKSPWAEIDNNIGECHMLGAGLVLAASQSATMRVEYKYEHIDLVSRTVHTHQVEVSVRLWFR